MSAALHLLIGFVAGGVLCFVIGWLLGRGRSAPSDNRLELELRQQLTQREAELAQEREKLTQTAGARATAEAQRGAAENLLAAQRALHESSLSAAKAAQEKALGDLRETFKALSADALKQSAPEFLRLAEQNFGKLQETAKGDLAQRQEAIKTLVEPLK